MGRIGVHSLHCRSHLVVHPPIIAIDSTGNDCNAERINVHSADTTGVSAEGVFVPVRSCRRLSTADHRTSANGKFDTRLLKDPAPRMMVTAR
jgi:hypothetical protein